MFKEVLMENRQENKMGVMPVKKLIITMSANHYNVTAHDGVDAGAGIIQRRRQHLRRSIE